MLNNAGENPKDRLLVQSENPLTEAMSQYVEKGVTDAIGDYVNRQIENMAAKLEKRLTLSTISKEGITEDIAELAGTSQLSLRVCSEAPDQLTLLCIYHMKHERNMVSRLGGMQG